MKKIFLFLLFFVLAKTGFCQGTNQTIKAASNNTSKTENYIYFFCSGGGELRKTIYINRKKAIQRVTVEYADTITEQRELLQPDFFQFLKTNLRYIRKLKNNLNSESTILKDRNKFKNNKIRRCQLGIKFKDLHYNHFPEFTTQEIEDSKNRKYAEGMKIINQLREMIKQTELNSL